LCQKRTTEKIDAILRVEADPSFSWQIKQELWSRRGK